MLNTSTTSVSKVQWNPVTVTNRPKKRGRNNEVTVLTGISVQENVWSFLPGRQKEVAVRRGSTVLFNNKFFLIHVLLTDACPLVRFSCQSDL